MNVSSQNGAPSTFVLLFNLNHSREYYLSLIRSLSGARLSQPTLGNLRETPAHLRAGVWAPVVAACSTTQSVKPCAASQLTAGSNPGSSYEFTRDNLGRLIEVDNDGAPNVPQTILTSAYDSAGNRTSLAVEIDATDDFLNTYAYDNLHRLTRLDQEGQSGDDHPFVLNWIRFAGRYSILFDKFLNNYQLAIWF